MGILEACVENLATSGLHHSHVSCSTEHGYKGNDRQCQAKGVNSSRCWSCFHHLYLKGTTPRCKAPRTTGTLNPIGAVLSHHCAVIVIPLSLHALTLGGAPRARAYSLWYHWIRKEGHVSSDLFQEGGIGVWWVTYSEGILKEAS